MQKKDNLNRPNLIIGNDVWIGANAIILKKKKKIGNGAVIGAGSIVTKDIPAYTIIAGNPAKEVRKRFNINQVNYIESTHWWEFNYSKLSKIYESIQDKITNL